jgi:hypothetical protein
MRTTSRNPFMIRTSEKIDSEGFFLRLFSYIALESLAEKARKGELWDQLHFIRSSPGAGKTSLMRIFQPVTLLALLRGHNQHKELFNFMKGIEALTDEKVAVLGVFLPIREYSNLADSQLKPLQQQRIFNASLNARLTLALLKSILDYASLPFPGGLARITCTYPDLHNYFKGLKLPCTGEQLYQWAIGIENQIAQALDSFNPADILGKEGHDEPFVFSCFQPSCFTVEGEELPARFLFMMDDVHTLPSEQRTHIKQYLNTRRLPVSIWLAERLSALSPEENLGNQQERDYGVINLEQFWSRNPRQYRKLLSSIAQTRADMSSDEVGSFEINLQEQQLYLDTDTPQAAYEQEIDMLASYTDHSLKFAGWSHYPAQMQGSFYDKAIACRLLLILAHREQARTQMALDFETSTAHLEQKLQAAAQLKPTAMYLVARQHKLPYYAGFENLVLLSNNNIQQFLAYCSGVFEHIIAQQLVSNSSGALTAPAQERVVRQVATTMWQQLPRLVSQRAVTFLQEVAKFADRETMRPTVPYSPGITGFAVHQSRSQELFGERGSWVTNIVYEPLARTLSDCVAYNLLVPVEITQGTKGNIHTVYYLNRWLCLHFNLVTGFGGWRPKKLDELIKWVK